MGERKVLNKYYPPDFDPSKIPRRRQPKNQQIKVRMMLPMSIRCNTCGNYIYKGTKFNSRKEDCIGETYLGIQILRFYFKCSRCSAELTMKTDPQNSDYVMETGATRNYEPWRAADEALDDAKKKRDAEELGDAMKALENRTMDSKQEMDILAALDEMKSMRARHASVGTSEMLEALKRTAEAKDKQLQEDDEALVRSVVFQNSSNFVRRLPDYDDLEFDEEEEEEDEVDLTLQERKRRKGLLGKPVVEENGQKKVLGPSLDQAEHEDHEKVERKVERKPTFSVKLQPVKFQIKPKATGVSNGEDKSGAYNGSGLGSEGKPLESIESGSQVPVPSHVEENSNLALASLGAAYDTSDSDSD